MAECSDKFECTVDFSKDDEYKRLIDADIKLCKSNEWKDNKSLRLYFGKEGEAYILFICNNLIKTYYPNSHIEVITTKEFFSSPKWCGFPKGFYSPAVDHQYGDLVVVYNFNGLRYVLCFIDVKRSILLDNPHQKGCIRDTYLDGVTFRKLVNSYFIRINFNMDEVDCIEGSAIKDSGLNLNYEIPYWPDNYLSSLGGNNSLEDFLINLIWDFFQEHPDLDGAPSTKPVLASHQESVISYGKAILSKKEGSWPTLSASLLESVEKIAKANNSDVRIDLSLTDGILGYILYSDILRILNKEDGISWKDTILNYNRVNYPNFYNTPLKKGNKIIPKDFLLSFAYEDIVKKDD